MFFCQHFLANLCLFFYSLTFEKGRLLYIHHWFFSIYTGIKALYQQVPLNTKQYQWPPPCSFANGHLQRGRSSRWPTFFGRMGLKFAPDLPLVWRILNTNFSSNGPTVQELEQSDRWTLTLKCVGNYALPVRWKVSRVIEYLPQLSQSSLSITDYNRNNKDQNSNKRFALFTWSS